MHDTVNFSHHATLQSHPPTVQQREAILVTTPTASTKADSEAILRWCMLFSTLLQAWTWCPKSRDNRTTLNMLSRCSRYVDQLWWVRGSYTLVHASKGLCSSEGHTLIRALIHVTNGLCTSEGYTLVHVRLRVLSTHLRCTPKHILLFTTEIRKNINTVSGTINFDKLATLPSWQCSPQGLFVVAVVLPGWAKGYCK